MNVELEQLVAQQLALPQNGVSAVISLLGEGNTVPFVARYRKERTGNLDEEQIRNIEAAYEAQVALAKRRDSILGSLREQGVLTSDLERKVRAAGTKTELEDIYLPFRPRRVTRASKARDLGLQPLADKILAQPQGGHPQSEARRFLGNDVPDVEVALAGARDIVAETLCEKAVIRSRARAVYSRHGRLVSKAIKKKTEGQRTKFEDYYDFAQPISRLPSHRYLAINRGEKEGFLRLSVDVDRERLLEDLFRLARPAWNTAWADELGQALEEGYKRLLAPAMAKEARVVAKERADLAAVEVFSANLRNLLLSSPLGQQPVVGIDPGFRTGCKCAAVDATGRFCGYMTIYPHSSKKSRAVDELESFLVRHRPYAIAIGNGTAGRETEAFVGRVLKESGCKGIISVSVNESGASVYSASEVARAEFPDLDLTIRGAISIARRLQDPLAELVKVDPKSLGIGQYQHDVQQKLLQQWLTQVVESCVNYVGVELNTASAELLAMVAGIGPTMAKKIVEHRNANGAFESRDQLLKVSGLGKRTYEQAAGFLRLRDALNPLDDSAVHPERYRLVKAMARDLRTHVRALVGNKALVQQIDPQSYVTDEVGLPTLRDILDELAKPGRDPRDTFEPPKFRDDIQSIDDLQPGMVLEGVVTNVTSFGAFVDLGVHQDGLVHISKLADRFVSDPHEVVGAGQKLMVRVLAVDLERRRISLSARDVD
jgi:protein Tex